MSEDPGLMAEDPQLPDCIEDANLALQRALQETCEMPLGQLRDLADDHGVRPIDLLARVEGSPGCFLDYTTGHVRCAPDSVEAPGLGLAEAQDDDHS